LGDFCAPRILEFFTAHIRNANTRKAYANAGEDFARWCRSFGIHELCSVQPVHVAAYVAQLTLSAPSVKQRLAALRSLFDWLVVGQVLPTNPAASVRGPRRSVTTGTTPVLSAQEARELVDAIETDTVIGLRDRALIGTMLYTFARVGAVTRLRVGDVYVRRRRAEAAGIRTRIGCHSFLATGITEYLRNGGKLEIAQQMANHESARTTGLYDRRGDQIKLDEVERIAI
jgi:site-specific recombinase XerD